LPPPANPKSASAISNSSAAGTPLDYLKDLFTRLPAARITQIQGFTPAALAKAKAKKKLVFQTA
jgi:hypothetical protein